MVGMLSDIGNVRKINEDYLGYHEDLNKKLYIVADGMGGHNAGEVASKLAVETTIAYVNSICCLEDLENDLREAIEFSNRKIYDASKDNNSLEGMGTTITACLIRGSKMVIANVGDSRCYIIQDDVIRQVTTDHSLVQQLLDKGAISDEEAAVHPNKNVITRSLGTSPKVNVDTFALDLKDVRKVILCTDGLSNSVDIDEIYEAAINNDTTSACLKLVELSKERGGRDNITVIIFEGECKDDRDTAR